MEGDRHASRHRRSAERRQIRRSLAWLDGVCPDPGRGLLVRLAPRPAIGSGKQTAVRPASELGADMLNAIPPEGTPALPDVERRRMILHLARNVATARQRAGWTQHQLAQAADLSRATIHLIEAGACDPRLSTVTSLAKALGQPAVNLFAEQSR